MPKQRKAKTKLKKPKAAKRVAPASRKKPRRRQSAKPKAAIRPKPGLFPSEEVLIEKEKFSQQAAVAVPAPSQAAEELPQRYGRDIIVLQVRDPKCLHAYWELQEATAEKAKRQLKEKLEGSRLILRVYDISQIIFNGSNAHSFFDLEINGFLGSWYIEVGPGRSWCVELGLRLSDGRFIKLLRSNTVDTPPDGPSWLSDEEWMAKEEDFARLYGMGFGFGKSSPVGKHWQKRIKKMRLAREISSRRPTS